MVDLSTRAGKPSRDLVRRAYGVQLTARKQGPGPVTLEGYASVTDTPYEMWDFMGPYTEVMAGGSFTKTLSETPHVQLLLNHGGLSMAATKAGTLRLSEDSTGLHMSAEVNAVRTDVRDMLTALEDGAVDEMSFAFRIIRQQWSPDYTQCDIKEVDIHRGDVSVVNFGANPTTSVGLRGLDLSRLSPEAAREMAKRLSVVVVDIDNDEEDDTPCPSCGSENDSDALYCDQCGASMSGAAPAGGPLALYSARLRALTL
jgi:HK97 family phage prohead protease